MPAQLAKKKKVDQTEGRAVPKPEPSLNAEPPPPPTPSEPRVGILVELEEYQGLRLR